MKGKTVLALAIVALLILSVGAYMMFGKSQLSVAGGCEDMKAASSWEELKNNYSPDPSIEELEAVGYEQKLDGIYIRTCPAVLS